MSDDFPAGASDRTAPDATDRERPADGHARTLAGADELVEILDGYLAALKSGDAPDRDAFLARHPDLASQLEACLAGLEFIHAAKSAELSSPQR